MYKNKVSKTDCSSYRPYFFHHVLLASDIVLEFRPWPRGASRPISYGIGFKAPDLGLGFGFDIIDNYTNWKIKIIN